MADLITLQEYKTAKGIVKDNQDDQIGLLIPAVSKLIQAYIGFPVGSTGEVTEVITPSYETAVVFLEGYPVQSITSVNELDSYAFGTGFDSTVRWPLLVDSGFRYDPSTGALFRLGGYWGTVEVTYQTGYDEIPEDLKLAAISLVEFYLKEQYIQSKTVMGTNVVHNLSKDMPSHVKLVLDSYKI